VQEGAPPDNQAPTIACPTEVVRDAPAGACETPVDFTVTASDDSGQATVECTPASGSTFPVGETPVTCVAVDPSGNRSQPCTFQVRVAGDPAGIVNICGATREFGPVRATRKGRKRGSAFQAFTVDNTNGCGDVTVSVASIVRVGGPGFDKIDPQQRDDGGLFSVTRTDSREPIGEVTVPEGESLTLRIRFTPRVPRVAEENDRLLPASLVVADGLVSQLTLLVNGEACQATLVGRIDQALQLVHPDDPSRAAFACMDKVGSEATVVFSAYDSNLGGGGYRASYQFLDGSGQPVAQPVEVDFGEAVDAAGLAPGQSFTITQTFTGVGQRITGVRVTVTDGDGARVDVTSSGGCGGLTKAPSVVVSPPAVHLGAPEARLRPRFRFALDGNARKDVWQ
jgi:hypothetical protein